MAEQFDKFWISIDADVSTLQTELIKAQNQLRQFQTTLKKSTDVESIKLLNANISFLDEKIAHLNTRMQGVAKPTADASQSLINLSRIAQDAPYGFIGIANNIYQML
jgi:predicted  nucleic acid-binding Zn-ribbon protein